MMGSKWRGSARVIVLTFCVAMVVAACARKEIRLHAVSYNKAISDYGNKQILLNAVRASKRYPMYFSLVGNMTGGGRLSGGVTTSFPFKTGPGNKLPTFGINPKADLKSGLTQINIANLNTKEFQDGLFKAIDPDLFELFWKNDWPKGVLFNIFVHKIKLSRSHDRMIGDAIEMYCKDAKHKGVDSFALRRCRTHTKDLIFYRDYCKKIYRKPGGGNYRYYNAGDHKCDQRRFQIFVSELRILQIKFERVYKKSKKNFELFSVKKKTVKKDGTLNRDGTEKITESVVYSEVNERTKKTVWIIGGNNKTLNSIKITVSLRSPHAMILFLGDLIKAQLYNDNRFKPTIIYGKDFIRLPLFEVRRGIIGRAVARPAVSVMHEGTDYYIPRPNYGDRYEARSLQVLDLINQVIVHQTVKSDLPKSSTIQLVGG